MQDWIVNRIKAKRVIVLLDTCGSGTLVGRYMRSRTAAIGRLHEATGRPVLTAAAEGKPAFEGYQGHGLFTWALLDALLLDAFKNADRNANGTIEVSELVAHVQDQVPQIATKLNGRGQAAIAARGSPGRPTFGAFWIARRRFPARPAIAAMPKRGRVVGVPLTPRARSSHQVLTPKQPSRIRTLRDAATPAAPA
jgi:hypothetical protein